MCGYCYVSGASIAGEAGALIGGPIVYAAYRKARRVMGLPDTAVAPVPVEDRAPERDRVGATRPGPALPVAVRP